MDNISGRPLEPPPGYLTLEAAAQEFGIGRSTIANYCLAYRKRIEREELEGASPDLVARKSGDEVACTWVGSGQRVTYFVQVTSLEMYRQPRAGRGRTYGARDRAPRPSRRKKEVAP